MTTKNIVKLGLAAIVVTTLHTNALAAEKQTYILTEADREWCGILEKYTRVTARNFQIGVPYSKSLAILDSIKDEDYYSSFKTILDGAHKQRKYFSEDLQQQVITEYGDKWFKACTDAIIEDEEGR